LQQGNYVLFLPLAVVSQLLSFIFRSFAWQTLLKKKVGVKKLFFTINSGYLVNNIFPFRAGEVARALLLSRNGLVSFWEAASTILIERAFDVLISVSILLGSLPFVFALKSHGDAAWACRLQLSAAELFCSAFSCCMLLPVTERNYWRG
jgi:uncharacterized protein (TIRG00374 family)